MKKKLWIYILIGITFVAIVGSNILISTVQGESIKSWFFSSANEKQEKENIVAIVNGEKIYQNQIDMYISFNRMQIENLPQEHKNEISPLTEKEVLKDLVRKKVMLGYAEDVGITIDKEAVEKYIRESYKTGKEMNDENFAFIKEYIEKTKLSEEEYIERATNAYFNSVLRSKLYDYFCEGKTENQTVLKEKFELFIDDLVNQSDVQILKNF